MLDKVFPLRKNTARMFRVVLVCMLTCLKHLIALVISGNMIGLSWTVVVEKNF